MAKIGMVDDADGLATYQIGFFGGAMYAKVDDPAWIEQAPFKLNGKQCKVGEVFTKLGGQRKATTFELQEGHWIEYVGRIDDLLLFNSDGESEDGWYYAFYQIDEGGAGRLLIANTNGTAADIQ